MLNNLPKQVRIVEVGPRDGLQNESKILGLKEKIQFIEMLAKAGLKNIEATSFVRADKIPQMGDARDLFNSLRSKKLDQKVNLPCLVPNLKGLESALEVGVSEIAIFTATSNTFNKKNINANIEESFERLRPVTEKAKSEGLKIRGYISTVFGCPYEGETSIDVLKESCENLRKMGVYEVSLGDTIGVANPAQVIKVISDLKNEFDLNFLAMHFHDTRGMAVANSLASLESGITCFDSSAGGLGGCPYAKGATGNVATEDLVYLFESMGINTGVDLDALSRASKFILDLIGKETSSKFLKTILGK